MRAHWYAININLWGLAGLLTLCAGCQSGLIHASREGKAGEELSSLRIHIQGTPDASGRTLEVPVFRARPMLVRIEREPFITEGNVVAAEVVDEPGGFSIQLEFDRQGRWLLEKYTAANMNRRVAIYGSYATQERWLAAPRIQKVITDGKLTFTPDATRDESLRFVRGLKNYARKMDHDPRF
jgi:hypothetical protein